MAQIHAKRRDLQECLNMSNTLQRAAVIDGMTERLTLRIYPIAPVGAGVAQGWCNGLPRDGPGFDSRWERCKNRAPRPPQGTVNGGAVSK